MGDDISACRVIFGEADRFLVLQSTDWRYICNADASYGMERLADDFPFMMYSPPTDAGSTVSMSAMTTAELEGLAEAKGGLSLRLTRPDSTVTEITENAQATGEL